MTSGRLLAIDPGLRETGAALFLDGVLTRCALIRGPKTGRDLDTWLEIAHATAAFCPEADTLVYEMMAVRERGAGRKRTSDVLPLVGIVGAIGATVPHTRSKGLEPFAWKGQVPKEIHHARALKALTLFEQAALEAGTKGVAASKKHNVLDAVALGLYALNRTLRSGVPNPTERER